MKFLEAVINNEIFTLVPPAKIEVISIVTDTVPFLVAVPFEILYQFRCIPVRIDRYLPYMSRRIDPELTVRVQINPLKAARIIFYKLLVIIDQTDDFTGGRHNRNITVCIISHDHQIFAATGHSHRSGWRIKTAQIITLSIPVSEPVSRPVDEIYLTVEPGSAHWMLTTGRPGDHLLIVIRWIDSSQVIIVEACEPHPRVALVPGDARFMTVYPCPIPGEICNYIPWIVPPGCGAETDPPQSSVSIVLFRLSQNLDAAPPVQVSLPGIGYTDVMLAAGAVLQFVSD